MTSRAIYVICAILTLTGLYVCWCGTPLIWDGAYQMAINLIHQRPFVYEMRFHTLLLWEPLIGLMHLTFNMKALDIAYGMPFLLAPVVGLLVSWWIVRRHAPWLMVWALFGTLAAPLPGQIFIINDSIFQQHLFWPLFLGMMVPLTRPQCVVLGFLTVFQFCHPVGMTMLAGAAITAGLLAWAVPEHRAMFRRRSILMGTLTLVALFKIVHWPDSYAVQEASWAMAQDRWRKGVAGRPLAGLIFMWLSGAAVFVQARLEERGRRDAVLRLAPFAILSVLAAGGIWMSWARNDRLWATALDYRRWLVPLTVPFYGFALAEGLLSRRRIASAAPVQDATAKLPIRPVLGYMLACLFAAILCTQSREFSVLSRRLMDDVRAYPSPLVPWSSMGWVSGTPMDHWGAVPYVAIMLGPTPDKVLIDDDGARTLVTKPGRIPLALTDSIRPEPGPAGWFDYRPLVRFLPLPGPSAR